MRERLASWRALWAATALAAAGCTAFVPKRATPDEGAVPAQFSLADTQGEPGNLWWHDFNSPELNGLVNEAMNDNLTLRQLWARLDQAGSIAVQSASGLYPELDLEADAAYTRTVTTEEVTDTSLKSQLRDAVVDGVTRGIGNGLTQSMGDTGSTGSSTINQALSGVSSRLFPTETTTKRLTRESRLFGLALAARYELDVWGRIASGYRAAKLDVQASREDLEATAITLAAEVTDRWLRILEQRELLRILTEQLETNRRYLELVELRFRNGKVSALDVYQQRQAVSEVQRLIPLAESAEQVLRHDLAVLLGKPPTVPLEIGHYDLSVMPDPPAVGIPAELLMRRPDVRSALARLHAADHRVASARADRLPAILLTGGIGYRADDIANIFNDWFLNLAGGLTAPLFDGFRREAEVERTLAVVEERLADYRLTVLIAIQEVEDAMIQERKQREHIAGLQQQLEDARNALRAASDRYQKGQNDYLPVLTALERTQSLARGLVVARRELLVVRISLYRALGGTWTQELQAPPRLSDELAEAKSIQS